MLAQDVNKELMLENWLWFSISATLLFIRFAVRIRTVGFKGFQGDDYCAMATLIFSTMDATAVHICQFVGQNLSVTPDQLPALSKEDIAQLEYGSKWQLTAWYTYPALIWSMKFTMLFFYKRLTFGSFHAQMVKWLMIFTGVSYFICVMVISTGCHPFHENWQVTPVPKWSCSFRPQNTVTVSTLNVITDAAILSIPVPMLWKLKVPWKKKLVIAAILSSGLFVIAAAIIRACVTLGGTPSGDNINRWGVRETVLCVLTVNVPILRPLFTSAFWRSGPYDPQSSTTGTSRNKSRPTWKGSRIPESGMDVNDVEMGNRDKQVYHVGVLSHSSSQENIIQHNPIRDDKVVVVQTFDVRHDDSDAETRRSSN